jgi:putative addiction module component (TIGR02574 family)
MNTYDSIFEAAMALPSSERIRLTEALRQVLPVELSPEWQAEIQTRLESVRSGEVQPIPAHEVMAAARARFYK